MKRFVLVYNPVSGHATFPRQLDEIIEAFDKRGAMLIPYRTKIDNSGLPDFIREAAPDGVIAAGGDGTLGEVVDYVVRHELKTPIAVYGSGTSNDFATFLNLTGGMDVKNAYFDRIVSGKTMPVDVGCANGRYFINVASAGMLTTVAHEVNVRIKNAIGKIAYYIRGIGEVPNFRALPLHIEADGSEYDVHAYFFVIVNSGTAGGLKNVAPLARLDDGKLDLIVVKKCSIPSFVALAKDVVSGNVRPDDPNLLYVQAKKITVDAGEAVEGDLDGEKGPSLPMTVETLPNAIEMFY